MEQKKYVENLPSFKNFIADIKADRLFHSIMLINPDLEFLMEYAKSLAGEILGEHSKHKVEKEIHPDFFVFGKDKAIDVTGAKDIISTVYVAPYEGDRKVYIISRFDELGPAPANKLLKTLEEPPTGVTFILLVQNASRVLQTLLSRAQKFYLEGYGLEETGRILEARGVKQGQLLSLETDGNLGEALRLANSSNPEKLASFALRVFENFKLTTDLAMTLLEADEFRDGAREMLSFFATLAELIIRARAGLPLNSTEEINRAVKKLSVTWNHRALVLIIEATIEGQKRLEANVSVSNVMDQFFLKILEVRRKCRV